MIVFIDAGHGGVWKPDPPKGDPGVVFGTKIESYYTYQYANYLAAFLKKNGFEVIKTREQNEYTVDNRKRTAATKEDDLFISIHFDSAGSGRRMIYYADLKKDGKSLEFAKSVDEELHTGFVRPSTSSRFGRLYIDDAKCPAILIEVNRIDLADDSEISKHEFSKRVLAGINRYLGRFSTPFQRVFLIKDGAEEQLNIERMSIVGDKLYIAIK